MVHVDKGYTSLGIKHRVVFHIRSKVGVRPLTDGFVGKLSAGSAAEGEGADCSIGVTYITLIAMICAMRALTPLGAESILVWAE